MKHINKKTISFIVLALAIIFTFVFLRGHFSDLKVLTRISLWGASVLGILIIITTVLNGLRIKYTLEPLHINLPAKEWLSISVTNSFWNYLPFQGGLISRGIYLKQKYQLNYIDFISITAATYLITFLSLSLSGIILAMLALKNVETAIWPVILYSLLAIFSLLILLFTRNGVLHKFIRLKKVLEIEAGLKLVLTNSKLVWSLIILDLLFIISYAVRLYLAAYFLGYNINILYFFAIAPIGILAIYTAITPGGLIIREALIGLLASALLVNVSEVVIASILDRAVLIIIIFSLGLICNYYLTHKAFSKKFNINQSES
ncbi:MAG: lysylphosphatidylglycerol synthase transmembrane domain-containing protein [Patescibacteria group bacterium]|jgi:uncharacterized membrane protein YbhN (UPF0104 family)